MSLLKKLREQAKVLKSDTYALYLASKDPRVPWYAKALLAVVVAYALSPIDLIPDFVPILGYLDDLIIVPLGVKLALSMIPEDVMNDCRARAANSQAPQNWVVGTIIVAIWILVVGWLGWTVWHVLTGKPVR